MGNVYVQKRGKVYQYQFAIASIDGKRKYKNKSGFRTKSESIEAGVKAYNEYINVGHCIEPSKMSYSDYLDYWMKEHCEINLKYHTIQAYQNIIKNHIKPKLGFYMLSQLTTSVIQEFINNIYLEKGFSKNFLKNILKVLKGSLGYATDVVGFIKVNPSLKVRLPKYDIPDSDPVYILSNEEVEKILERFSNNPCVYYAFLTAYYTGLRVSEVFGLTWDDIDLEERLIHINHNLSYYPRHDNSYKCEFRVGEPKTAAGYRYIPMMDPVYQVLKDEYERQSEEGFCEEFVDGMTNFVFTNRFGMPHNPAAVNRAIKRIVETHNAEEEVKARKQRREPIMIPKFSNHILRHTFASRFCENETNIKVIQEVMGHADVSTTMNIYAEVNSSVTKSSIQNLAKNMDVF